MRNMNCLVNHGSSPCTCYDSMNQREKMTFSRIDVELGQLEAYRRGFREAIEKAAKLLEDESTRLVKDSVNHADIIRSYIDCLAQLIRAMSEAKPEESNDESK